MRILIHNVEEAEAEALAQATERVLRFYGIKPGDDPNPALDKVDADVFCFPRQADGWLQYTLRLPYSEGGGMSVAMIQREPGAGWEFHS